MAIKQLDITGDAGYWGSLGPEGRSKGTLGAWRKPGVKVDRAGATAGGRERRNGPELNRAKYIKDQTSPPLGGLRGVDITRREPLSFCV